MEHLSANQREKLEAAMFRRLLKHLQDHPEIQNIELMLSGGFCRNCFSKWLVSESAHLDQPLSLDEARHFIYDMDYGEWKQKYQTEATPQQKEAYAKLTAK
ncbi:MAG: DUF1244 domain-containing protein [Pseudomonadota bacterium]